MITFLIQTVEGQIVHDFSFYLLEAIKYNNWYEGKPIYQYLLSEGYDEADANCIPVGTVEFVLGFLARHHGIKSVRPINIPEELRMQEFTKRWIRISKSDTPTINTGEAPIFVKENSVIKGFCNVINKNQQYPAGEYLISEIIDIESEWRAFVYRKELVGLQNYLGDFTLFPDVEKINQMIKAYKNCPPAYTLDVGVSKKYGTFIIECHSMFSCGLYGFSNHTYLPRMLIQAYRHLIGSNKN